jgi:ABC-type hemin transport system substrate-binding protein
MAGDRLLVSGKGMAADGVIRLVGAVEGYENYKAINDEAVISAAPDFIVAMQCGDGSRFVRSLLLVLSASRAAEDRGPGRIRPQAVSAMDVTPPAIASTDLDGRP